MAVRNVAGNAEVDGCGCP